VLAINPGLSNLEGGVPVRRLQGRLGDGRLNLTYLLRAKDGTWYAASAGWNDPKEGLENSKLTGLMQRVLYLLGKGPTKIEEGK
jgi:hypothetical protein